MVLLPPLLVAIRALFESGIDDKLVPNDTKWNENKLSVMHAHNQFIILCRVLVRALRILPPMIQRQLFRFQALQWQTYAVVNIGAHTERVSERERERD